MTRKKNKPIQFTPRQQPGPVRFLPGFVKPDLSNARLKQVIWDNEAMRAVLDAMAPNDMQADAARLLTACMMATDPGGSRPEDVKAMLCSIGRGYGHDWQRLVADAIIDADLPSGQRDILYGAFRMAEAFLLDIAQPA